MPIHLIRLFWLGIYLNLLRIRFYSLSFILEMLGNMAYVAIVLIFWDSIYTAFPSAIGWTPTEMYLFLGYVELFVAVKRGFFPLTGKLWRVVMRGEIDAYLTRPIPPALLFIVNNLRLELFFPSIPTILFLFWKSSSLWTSRSLLAGFMVVLFAVIVTALLEITASGLVFWFGNISAVDEIVDSFYVMNNYPLILLDRGWQVLFTFIFPFMFNATLPSLIAAGIPLSWMNLSGAGITLIIWSVLVYVIWREGRRRYEGYGG